MTVTSDSSTLRTYRGKRSLDVVVAGSLLAAAMPVMALVAALIWLEDRRHPIFRQERVGANGIPFVLAKFRSMPVETPNVASVDAGAIEITQVGRVIRRLSVDELPQLLAILAGSMSVVGPRPALPSQTDVLAERDVGGSSRAKPGLTGWAQVNSFDGMPVATKVEFDNEYVAKMSFRLDLTVLLRTFGYVLRKPPAY